MGIVTLFVTKTFVDSAVNAESTFRTQEDDNIKISLQSLAESNVAFDSSIVALKQKVIDIKNEAETRVGSDVLSTYLSFPANYEGTRGDNSPYALTQARNVKEGLNALSSILQNYIDDNMDITSLSSIQTLNQQLDGYITDYNLQVSRIDAILNLAPKEQLKNPDGSVSEQTIDTFDEVIKLIDQLASSTSDDSTFTAYKANVDALIEQKADIVQTIDTKTRYVDAATNKKYKLYITNGQLAIEDVVL